MASVGLGNMLENAFNWIGYGKCPGFSFNSVIGLDLMIQLNRMSLLG